MCYSRDLARRRGWQSNASVSSPKISTPVENTVENLALPGALGTEYLYILSVSVGAKVSKRPVFGLAIAMNSNLPTKLRVSQRRKSHFCGFFRA